MTMRMQKAKRTISGRSAAHYISSDGLEAVLSPAAFTLYQ